MFKEGKDNNVEMMGLDEDSLSSIIEYFYTGRLGATYTYWYLTLFVQGGGGHI